MKENASGCLFSEHSVNCLPASYYVYKPAYCAS